MVRNEVGNVSASVQAAVPAGDDVDLSQLTDAERQLDAAYVDIQDLEDDTVRYLGIVEDVIWAAGAAAFALGIWGFVTLLARVRPSRPRSGYTRARARVRLHAASVACKTRHSPRFRDPPHMRASSRPRACSARRS